MKARLSTEKRNSSGEKPEDEIEIEEGEIQGEYNANSVALRYRQETRRFCFRGRMPRKSRLEKRDVQERLEEVNTLTNRLTPQSVSKSAEIVCKDIKSSIKKLDKVRRLMKWRGEFDFREYLEIVEYVQKILSGLRLLHDTCKAGQEKKQSLTLVQELIKTTMNYRHVLFSKSQKREIEAWHKESIDYPVCEEEKNTDSRDSDGLNGKSASGSRLKTESISDEDHQIENSPSSMTDMTPADALASIHQTSLELPKKQKSLHESTPDDPLISLNNKHKIQETFAAEKTKKSLGDSPVGEDQSAVPLTQSIKHEEQTGSNDSTKRKDSSPEKSKEITKRQKSTSEETGTTCKSEIAPELKSFTNALPASALSQQHSTIVTSFKMDARIENKQVQTKGVVPPERKTIISHGSIAQFEYSTTPHYNKHHNLCCNPFSYCAWPQRVPIDRESQNRRRNLREDYHSYGIKQQANLNGLGGARSIHYKQTNESHGFGNRAAAFCGSIPPALTDIPPPPPPIVFKPRPISPDVVFESPVDGYWDELLSNLQIPKIHQIDNKDFRDPIFDGKLFLVLDLDFALLSTTKFSELDSDSDTLLKTCVESEMRLPLFARTFHRLELLQIWVKLRPGLNKFLRIARNAFWLYGHTTRSREETEMILKLFDPEGCFLGNRIVYQERAPGESIFKKVKSLSPMMSKFAPITFILDDGCLSWEDPASVFGIESYLFFPESKSRFGLNSKSMFETKSDEEDCGFLMNALDILLQIRQQSFWRMSHPDESIEEDIVSRLPSQLVSMVPWDVRRLMAESRIQILQDVVIAFDRVLEPDEPVEEQILWRMATSMGAKCSIQISDQTTHVITVDSMRSTESDQFVVTPIWVEASYTLCSYFAIALVTMSTDVVRHLAEVFKKTLQSEQETRRNGEQELNSLAASRPDFVSCVLQVVASAVFPLEIRLAAAVNFKNCIKSNWDPDDPNVGVAISDQEKASIRVLVIEAMVGTPGEVRMQISEALNLISQKDFPQRWPELIPSLAEKMATRDLCDLRGKYSTAAITGVRTLIVFVTGVLETGNSVFKRFRNRFMNSQVSTDLEISQRGILKPLLQVLRFLNSQLTVSSKVQMEEVCECVRLVFRIFYSLNVFGLTEIMEPDLKEWMRSLFNYLEFSPELLVKVDRENISPLDSMKAAVCEILNVFIQVNEEDFEEYLEQFVSCVWNVLSKVTIHPCQDKLVISALSFLTAVAKGTHVQIFERENVLQQIFTAVIVPSLKLREDDIELFEMNGIEYIRRDTEGSDSDTRRRAAADLVRTLAEPFPNEVTRLCTSYIGSLLESYHQNPVANIYDKDCAIFMVVALAVKGKTVSQGATSINSLVPLMQFWKEQIEPEILAIHGVNHAPLLKADALKFLNTFRSHIPKDIMMGVLPKIIDLLKAENFIVHSYAATLLERLMVLLDNNIPRFTGKDFIPFLQPLLENLFAAFEFPDSLENAYIMKCVMRSVELLGPEIQSVAQACLQALSRKLLDVCKNPQGPVFNHYLFEAVAALVSSAAGLTGAVNMDNMQCTVFPAFEIVLQQDVQEFHPYVFQILALFVDRRPVPLPDVYLSVLPPALTVFLWERQGNVPALTKLIRAYVRKVPDLIVQNKHLEPILGIFQRLNALKSADQHGLAIMEDLYCYLNPKEMDPYHNTIWTLIFQRLQGAKTAKYTKAFIRLGAVVILRWGIVQFAEMLNKIQSGIIFMILEQIWVPSMTLVEGTSNRMICSLAGIKILTEFTPLITQSPALWARLLEALIKTMEGTKSAPQSGPSIELKEPDMDDLTGYSAAFAQLRNAQLSFELQHPCPEDPKLITHLSALNAAMNQQEFGTILHKFVSPEIIEKLIMFSRQGMN
eukprot:g6945.t1